MSARIESEAVPITHWRVVCDVCDDSVAGLVLCSSRGDAELMLAHHVAQPEHVERVS